MSIEEITITGYLGDSPRKHESNHNLIYFSVGVSNSKKNQLTNEYDEKTNWYKIFYNSNKSEHYFKLFKKGDQILVKGKINYNIWENSFGEKKFNVSINANYLNLIKKKYDTTNIKNEVIKDQNIDNNNNQLPDFKAHNLDDEIPF